MLLSPQKKKITILVGRPKEKADFVQSLGESSNAGMETGSSESDSSYGLEASMQKFIGCMKSDDPKGCAQALSDFMTIWEMEPHEEASREESFE
jgi:hypothetical protein